MADMKVLVAGLVHDHVWAMLGQFKKLKGVTLAAAADPNAPLRVKIAKEFGVRRTYADWRRMLREVDADAILLCGSNAGNVPVAEAAAARKLHLLVEKPMAATAEQAKRMAAAARRHGVRLMVNWPTAWSPANAKALELVAAGDIGHVFHARIHMAHQGPKEAGCTPYFWGWLYDRKENGGGAIVDYCCYGAATLATLWGRPRQIQGVARTLAKPRFPVDDNAMITAIYDKRIGVAQASWTQNPDFHDILFLGTKGTLRTDNGKLIRTFTRPQDFSHWGANRQNAKEIRLRPFPRGRRNGPEHFVHCLRTGRPFLKLCSAETGVLAQEILSAGIESDRTGRRLNFR